MSRFSKQNFMMVLREIEAMEKAGENFWVPVGILEIMYDDDCGYIDQFFHSTGVKRDREQLWEKLQGHIAIKRL